MAKKATPNDEKRLRSNRLNKNGSIARCFTLKRPKRCANRYGSRVRLPSLCRPGQRLWESACCPCDSGQSCAGSCQAIRPQLSVTARCAASMHRMLRVWAVRPVRGTAHRAGQHQGQDHPASLCHGPSRRVPCVRKNQGLPVLKMQNCETASQTGQGVKVRRCSTQVRPCRDQ